MASPTPGNSKTLPFVVIIVVVLLAGVGYWYWSRQPDQPNLPSLTSQEAQRLVQLAAEANACLENEKFRDGFDRAESRLQQIKDKLPDSLFVYRNLVISRILFFGENKDELQDDQQFISETTALIEDLIERDSSSFEPYVLAVRWRYQLNNDIDATDVELLEKAIEHAGDSPVPYYEFHDRTSILDDQVLPGIEEKRKNALAEAYRLQPDNVKLATLYLQQLAEAQSEKFGEVWQQFQDQLSPLVVSADLELLETTQQEFAAKIDEAYQAGDWSQTLLNVRRLSNLIKRGEVLKIDLARIQPYELEFLKFELDEAIVKLAAEETVAAEPVAVELELAQSLPGDAPWIAVRAVDFDIDNRMEIAALAADRFVVFKPSPEGDWQPVCEVPLEQEYIGFLAADLDYDKKSATDPTPAEATGNETISNNYSDPDFVFYGETGVAIYENRFTDEGQRTLVRQPGEEFAAVTQVTAATLVDIDHDKDLDLLLGTADGVRLFLARGNLTFYDFSEHSAWPPADRRVTSFDIVDLDRDIDIDVLVGFESGEPGYLENLGHSQLRFRGLSASLPALEQGRQLFAVEMDRRPSWDLLCETTEGITLTTTETTATGIRQKSVAKVEAVNLPILTVADFNNDGFVDVVGGDAQQAVVWLGTLGAFASQPMELPAPLVAADAADLDGDGLVDLVGLSPDRQTVQIWSNRTSTDHHWLNVSVCGRDSNFPKGRINNHAIGSFVELRAGDHYFATTIQRPQLHFGLGDHEQIDLVRFLWTSGMPQSLVEVQSGQNVYEEMFEKGSCPYIYTWDGSKFTFFSDCLWAAPLGLQSAPGQFIPCRSWEYLKIPGEILQPRDGRYVLQITEELREAAYFDLVKLYAVDHPADVEIFTNEKVGPPFIAEHRIHTVRNPRLPVAARDPEGRDVLPDITQRDGKYFRGFEERIGKGLTPLHFLELDFGDLKSELAKESGKPRMTLFLHGWIRPTDCSLNISYAQNPDEPSPIPPVVLVPDQSGDWVKTIDPMGFPGGKPKTIAVDLSDAFLCDDYRIRIQTSHEIYWDQVFFTINEPAAEVQETELKLLDADLHYRGFSRRFTNGPDAPELYDYQQVNVTPRWPAMTGRFTRYGDVRELLTDADDCSVVIGAGDEMTVSFEALADPPPGWKRDFVIHLVGFDKDGDLNTVTGQSSEPLPFRAMKSYPYGMDEDFPDTPRHRDYLKKYQTRRQSWGAFWKTVTPTDSH